MSRFLFVLLLGLALLSLLANVLSFGGDPEIHLVFAQNLLRGYPLQFNPGIHTSGETSPLYAALLAGMLYLTGVPATAVFMKLLGVGSAVGLLLIVRESIERALADARLAALITCALAAAPFFFFQAQLGMENMPFAFGVAWLVRRLERAESVIAVSAAAHASFFFRPEAVFLIATVYGAILLDRRRRLQALAISCGLSIVLVTALLGLERATGVPLYGAGEMRALASRLDSFAIPGTPLALSARPWIFLAYAWPLLAAIALQRRHVPALHWVMLACLIGVPLLSHVFNLLPNTHFTRYALYFWFPLLLVAASSMRANRAVAARFAILFALNAACVASGELAARVRVNSFANTQLLRTLALGKAGEVERLSDALCAQIDCSRPPVRIALYEVQLRLRLDDRFEVHSLDGVVDIELRRFVMQSGDFDLVGYVQAEEIDLILDLPVAHPPGKPSLWQLYEQAASGPVRLGCSRFERRALNAWLHTKALARTRDPGCH